MFITQQFMHMHLNTQIILGFLVSAVVAATWWVAAVRLRRHWSLFAMAICNTVGVLLSVALVSLLVYRQPGASFSGTFEWISGVQSALGIAQAVCFALFVAWLVGRSFHPARRLTTRSSEQRLAVEASPNVSLFFASLCR